MLTVATDKLHYADEYDPMHEVYYGTELFTGIAQTELGTIEYLNGKAHGRYIYRFDSGILAEEGTYVEGECVQLRTWYEDGTLRETYQEQGIETSKWDKDGILAYQAGEDRAGNYEIRWFYKDGVVKQHTTTQGTDYFATDGRLAMQVTYRQPQNSVRYIADVLKTNYLDIVTHYYVEADDDKSNTAWYFWGWVWQLLEKPENRPTAMAILHHLNTEGFSGAASTLKTISTSNLDTFQGSMSYRIVP